MEKKILVFTLIFSGGIYFLLKYILRGSGLYFNYSENYKFDLLFIIKNSWNYINLLINSLNPFFSLVVIAPVLLIFKKFRQKLMNQHLVYWFLVFACFTAILFPWRFVYDRYMLPAIFAFCVFITILIGKVVDEMEKPITYHLNKSFGKASKVMYYAFIILILSNFFFMGAGTNFAKSINYRNWFAIFAKFEGDQVEGIAKLNDVVYLNAENNMDNWEVTYEIPMHINYFYGNTPEVKMIGEDIPSKGYIFTRSSLNPIFDDKKDLISKYPVVDSRRYLISQVNVEAFNRLFMLRPIQAFRDPPLEKEGIDYYWEIRKIK